MADEAGSTAVLKANTRFVERISEASARTSAAVVYAKVKSRIFDNTYGPDVTVTVQELVDEFGISRTPIRDALIRLEQERLVKITPRHGFRVLPMRPDEMLEIYQLVAGLECISMELMIERGMTADELAQLRASCADMKAALEADDIEAWSTADTRFHGLLIEFCTNRAVRQVALDYNEQIWRVRALTLRVRPKPVDSTRSHCEAVEALAAGDAQRATRLHWEQRRRSSAELAEILARMSIRQL